MLLSCSSGTTGSGASGECPGTGTSPRVCLTFPATDATDVPVATIISATFSETMDAGTLGVRTFAVTFVSGTATGVSGTVLTSGNVSTFSPEATLAPNTTYTATIRAPAKTATGAALGADFVWHFTTAAGGTGVGVPLPSTVTARPGAPTPPPGLPGAPATSPTLPPGLALPSGFGLPPVVPTPGATTPAGACGGIAAVKY